MFTCISAALGGGVGVRNNVSLFLYAIQGIIAYLLAQQTIPVWFIVGGGNGLFVD